MSASWRSGPASASSPRSCCAAGASVTAVELDSRLAEHLRTRFESDAGLTLVEGDFLDVEVADVAADPWALVANVPYHITSPILHHVLGAEPRPTRFVMMVQKEVAERIASPPGGMSYLSVFVQYHAEVRIAFTVPAAAFEPAPEVDSAILVGETRPRRLDEDDEDELWRLVQAGFRERRKMIHNVLARQLPGLDRERVDAALRGCWHRARPAAADALGRGVAGAARGADAAAMTTPLRAEAPAKVNLALAITGLRDDGYHLLRSVFLRLALHDVLEVRARPRGRSRLARHRRRPAGQPDNLVLRAAATLRAAIDPALPPLRFRLVKRIPAAAGLGGGSSDAAAAIDLALEAWGVRLHPAARLDVALRLGADVPFFAAGHGVALVEGIGEHLVPLSPPRAAGRPGAHHAAAIASPRRASSPSSIARGSTGSARPSGSTRSRRCCATRSTA